MIDISSILSQKERINIEAKLAQGGLPGSIWDTLNNRRKISMNILLEHHIYPVDYNGATIIVLEIPRADRRDKPIYVGQDIFKGTFRRNYEGDYHCTREESKGNA